MTSIEARAHEETGPSPAATVQGARQRRRRPVWIAFPTALAGGLIVATIVAGALVAPWITTYDPIKTDLRAANQPPSGSHLLGTDALGRDIVSRMLYGGRTSLATALVAISVAVTTGSLLGLVSGYWSGTLDLVLMRMMDALLAVPALVLALGLAAALGPGLTNGAIAIGVVYVPGFARLVRGQVLALREEEFVLAAQALGAGPLRILARHLLPNALVLIVVFASLRVPSAILAEASLSFLGLGAPPPTPTWGSMVNMSRGDLEQASWAVWAPSTAIFLTVVGLSMLGDGIRDALDPRMRTDTGSRP